MVNKPPYNRLIIPQKDDFGKFIEVSLLNGKPSFRKGILESNELWLLLNENFFPYLTEKDFNKFPRQFRCVSANIENGEAVELSSGNITSAVRASMAIPSVFTPVKIDGKTLVDGGVVRNFPVSTAKKMGADIVIGSTVSSSLMTSDELDNPLEIISQVAFYKESSDYEKQVKSADIFVNYDLKGFGSSSFSSSDIIMKIGDDKGKEIYPQLKKLKDSLDQIYGTDQRNFKVKRIDSVKIAQIKTEGLSESESEFFLKNLGFKSGNSYTASDISENIRRVFGAGFFRKINYQLEKNDEKTVNLKLIFEKEPNSFIRTGLHYNSETGISLKLAYAKYGFLKPFSLTSVGVSIGENPQISLKRFYFFNHNRDLYLQSNISGEYTDIYTYNENFKKNGFYNQLHFKAETGVYKLLTSNFSVGTGLRFEAMKFSPKIEDALQANGSINFFNPFAILKFNNLDTPHFPNSGSFVDFEGGFVFNQNTKFTYNETTETTHDNASEFGSKSYFTLKLNSAVYFPLDKNAIFLKLNSGIHFGNKIPLMNNFLIGGINTELRNQVLFSGFRVNAKSSSSVFSPQIGFRYTVAKNFYATLSANYLLYDFIKENVNSDKSNSVFGSAITFSYNSFLGPIDASFMFNSLNKSISPNFNIGYSFNF